MPGKVALRLPFLGKRAAFAALTVPPIDNGGANAFDHPVVFVVLANGVLIDGLAFVIYHVHGLGLLYQSLVK